MPRRKRVTYQVRPRYTAGSPAQVDAATAHRVADEEREFIEHALEGFWGDEQKARAENLGLDFIAFTMTETRTGWEIEDLITSKRHFWPFTAACPTCKAKRVECQRGQLTPHYQRLYGECQDRSYLGKEIL
jgi:hypothetical protein